MTPEEKIKQELAEKFDYLKDSIVIKRERRIFIDVALENWMSVFGYLVKNMHFAILSAITGLDEGSNFAVIYHLSKDNCVMLNMRTKLPRENPAIHTVTGYFPSADSYEREMVDLLGIKVKGLKEGHHYPLPDNWPKNEFPLRKDWKVQKTDDRKQMSEDK